MLQLPDIRRVHVELTTRCNARCPMCPRNYRGYDYNGGYPVTELTVDDFKHIFTPEFLAQLTPPPPEILSNGHVKQNFRFYGINFNGNLGDFSSAQDGREIVEYVVSHGVAVNITTNGHARSAEWWAGLAHPKVTVGFALDGLADTHSLYRQDTDWHRVIANARAYIAAGGRAIWRFIPFDHNRHQEDQCRQMAKDLGFEQFENIYDGRDRGPVYTRSGEFSHWIGPVGEPERHIPHVQDLLQGHRTWFNHRTIRIEKDTAELNIVCEHKRQEEIYIAADGSVWPCCFLGYYPGQMHHPGNEQLLPLVRENNALEYDLAHCMAWFDRIEDTWQRASVADGRLYQCVNSCNRV